METWDDVSSIVSPAPMAKACLIGRFVYIIGKRLFLEKFWGAQRCHH